MTFSKSCLTASRPYLLSGIVLSPVYAGEVIYSYVDYRQGHYLLNLEMRIEAPPQKAYAVITRFNDLPRLNNSIKLSRLLASQGQQHTVLIESEACIWFFCRRITQVQRVTEMGDGYLQSITDPAQSDMVSGRVLWHVRADPRQAEHTLMTYRADFEPDFFVPPLIGPWLLKKRLLTEGRKTINGIEWQARHDAH